MRMMNENTFSELINILEYDFLDTTSWTQFLEWMLMIIINETENECVMRNYYHYFRKFIRNWVSTPGRESDRTGDTIIRKGERETRSQ